MGRSSSNGRIHNTRLYLVFIILILALSLVLLALQHQAILEPLQLLSQKVGGSSWLTKNVTSTINDMSAMTSKGFKYVNIEKEYTSTKFSTSTANVEDSNHKLDDKCSKSLPKPFCEILERSKQAKNKCTTDGIFQKNQEDFSTIFSADHADLPPFGILAAIQDYIDSKPVESMGDTLYYPNSSFWSTCQVPPQTACHVQAFSIVVMGYNPDRLAKLHRELISKMQTKYLSRVEEAILVWNGGSEADFRVNVTLRAPAAKYLIDLHEDPSSKFRIWFPLDPPYNLRNSLFNRYHPALQPKSEAVLYFDDDGPFFMQRGIEAGFNMWRRHSIGQVGAMGRSQHLSQRQEEELKSLQPTSTTAFQSHCRNPLNVQVEDKVEYDYHIFPYFGAHMVLPSGSILHRNYLCFLWHPIFQALRELVIKHPVFPDDITVSSIVSQVSGHAPRVYPRQAHPVNLDSKADEVLNKRKLLYLEVENWPAKRTHAVNAVWGYFGSVTTGSVGWCYNTASQVSDTTFPHGISCMPFMPPINLIEYQNEGGFEYDICGDGYIGS